MEFGRLPSVDGVDVTLPDEPPANGAALARLRQATDGTAGVTPQVLLGSPQWGHAGYVGRIYPPRTPQRDYLHHYARQFPTVELNTTFYGIRPAAIATWRDSVPPGFRFCPKLPKTITHDLRLADAVAETAAFVEAIETFGEHLGPAWMLLGEDFGPAHGRALVDFVRAWPSHIGLGVELRHRDWFAQPQMLDALLGVFEETGTIAVITDVVGRRDVLHMRVTAPTVMLRFVGNRLHPTDFARADAWAERLAAWLDAGVSSAYVFLHQPEEELNVDVAEHLGRRLHECTGLDVQVPERVELFEQASLF